MALAKGGEAEHPTRDLKERLPSVLAGSMQHYRAGGGGEGNCVAALRPHQ